MHQTVSNVLRTLVHTNPPQNMASARDMVDDALAMAMYAMQTSVATSLGSAPGSLAFARHMFLNVPLISDWQTIARVHEHHIYENLCQANRKCYQFDYALGQQVMKNVHDPTKLGVRTDGPYTIECAHVNWKPNNHIMSQCYRRYQHTQGFILPLTTSNMGIP